MDRHPLRLLILDAERRLAAAGVESPRVDAEVLAAHVVGVERGRLLLHPLVDGATARDYAALVARRATREPLQHLLGVAVLGPVQVAVGPGVFTPRPETELLVEWGLAAVADVESPVVVDLCAGSGAIGLAVAASRPDAVVHAVEADRGALAWLHRNVAAHGGSVSVHAADVRWPDLLPELQARVHLVLCNPPYVPDGTALPAEVALWEPPGAVYGGADGLDVIRAVIATSAALLRHGGHLAIEHDDAQGGTVPALLRRRRVLTDVQAHRDLAGRARFATARRTALVASPGRGAS